jgi:hypothetical protein
MQVLEKHRPRPTGALPLVSFPCQCMVSWYASTNNQLGGMVNNALGTDVSHRQNRTTGYPTRTVFVFCVVSTSAADCSPLRAAPPPPGPVDQTAATRTTTVHSPSGPADYPPPFCTSTTHCLLQVTDYPPPLL